jgi:hypothetical protein
MEVIDVDCAQHLDLTGWIRENRADQAALVTRAIGRFHAASHRE